MLCHVRKRAYLVQATDQGIDVLVEVCTLCAQACAIQLIRCFARACPLLCYTGSNDSYEQLGLVPERACRSGTSRPLVQLLKNRLARTLQGAWPAYKISCCTNIGKSATASLKRPSADHQYPGDNHAVHSQGSMQSFAVA